MNPITKKSLKQRGFLLLTELMIVIPIITLLMGGFFYVYNEYSITQKAKRAGAWQAQIAQAADAFAGEAFGIITNQYSNAQLANAIAAGGEPAWKAAVAGIAVTTIAPVAPSTIPTGTFSLVAGTGKRVGSASSNQHEGSCIADNKCTRVTIAELINYGFLPAGFGDKNEYGLPVSIILRVVTPPAGGANDPKFGIDGIVITANANAVIEDPAAPGTVIPDQDGIHDMIEGGSEAAPKMSFGWVREATADDLANSPTQMAAAGLAAGQLGIFGVRTVDTTTGAAQQFSYVLNLSPWVGAGVGIRGQVVARFGYTTAAWSAMDRRDGSLAWTGDHNAGGFALTNASTVQVTTLAKLNQMCNNPASAVDVEKLPVGTLARMDPDNAYYSATIWNALLSATVPNPIGKTANAGMILACIDDGSGVASDTKGYSWQKVTAGPLTLTDGSAGVNNGLESDGDWICWNHNGVQGLYFLKAVFASGSVTAYVYANNRWEYSGPAGGVGYPIGYDWTFQNGMRWPVPVSDANGLMYCKWPGRWYNPGTGSYDGITGVGDPQGQALGVPGGSGVIMPNLIDLTPDSDFYVYPSWKFTASGIQFSTRGFWDLSSVASAKIPAHAFNNGNNTVTGNTAVSGTDCFTDALGNTSCGPNSGATATTGAVIDNTEINLKLGGFRQNMKNAWDWSVHKRSQCVDMVNGSPTYGKFKANCPYPG